MGVEWEFSNVNLTYPFVSPVTPATLVPIFVDAYITGHSEDSALRFNGLSMPDETTVSALHISYINGAAFITNLSEPDTSYSTSVYGNWLTVSMDNVNERKFVRLVLNREKLTYPLNLVGGSAVFVQRVTDGYSTRVNRLIVKDDQNVMHTLTGGIHIRGGYNTTLDVAEEFTTIESTNRSNNRKAKPVTLTVASGSGDGREPADCDQDLVLTNINGVRPDDKGNVGLDFKNGWKSWIEVVESGDEALPVIYELAIDNDNISCCDCEEYVAAYNRIRGLQQSIFNMRDRVNNSGAAQLNSLLNDMWDKYQNQKSVVSMTLTAKHFWIVTVQFIFRNCLATDVLLPEIMCSYYNSSSVESTGRYLVVPGSGKFYNPMISELWEPTIIAADDGSALQSHLPISCDFPGFNPKTKELMCPSVAPGGDWDNAIPLTETKVGAMGGAVLAFDIYFYEKDIRTTGANVVGLYDLREGDTGWESGTTYFTTLKEEYDGEPTW